MNVTLPILGTIALVVAGLLTLLTTAATEMFTMRKPSGPDAMALAGPLFASIGAWVLIALAAAFAGARGAFGWFTDAPATGAVIAIFTVVGIGGAAVVGMGASFESWCKCRAALGLGTGFVLPVIVGLYVASLLWTPAPRLQSETWPRVFAYPLAGVAVLAWLSGLFMYMRHMHIREQAVIQERIEQDKRHEEHRQEALKADAEHAAQLAAMPDDAPLPEFLTHLFIDKSDEHHVRAMARIAGLSNIRERIETTLSDPTPIQREYCANYIRHCEVVDAALAPAVGRAIVLLADDIERAAPSGELKHARGMTLGILMTAERFTGVRFEEEAKRLRRALDKWPHDGTRVDAVGIVDRYLKGEPVKAGG